MTEHIHDHHNSEIDSHDVALLDPADCEHFMESAHMHEHMHDHDHDHGHHHHDHDHGHVTQVTWRLITMIFLTISKLPSSHALKRSLLAFSLSINSFSLSLYSSII